MKYNLIIGYQLSEKHLGFPTARIFVNRVLVDEFLCDNEESTEITTTCTNHIDVSGSGGYSQKYLCTETYNYLIPKKFKVYELDSSTWPNKGKLTIEVINNKSNYNNGFVSKHSIVAFNPLFLIPKDLLDDKETMYRIMNHEAWAHYKCILRSFQERCRWPGLSFYTGKKTADSSVVERTRRGGNFNLDFDVVKKHGVFILAPKDIAVKGIFHVETFFRAWYQHYTKQVFSQNSKVAFYRDAESIHVQMRNSNVDVSIDEKSNNK